MLPVPDPHRLCFELRQLRRLIAAGAPLALERQLANGMRVRVRSGSLIGVEGIVIRRRGQTRLLVAVDFLQQGASMLIDESQLEPVE